MLDQDENNFAWGEGRIECADLNVTHYKVFHSSVSTLFAIACRSGWPQKAKISTDGKESNQKSVGPFPFGVTKDNRRLKMLPFFIQPTN